MIEIGIDFEAALDNPGEYVQEFCGVSYEERQPGAMEETLADHVALYSYVVGQYEIEKQVLNRMENRLSVIESEVFNEIQDEESGLAIGRTHERVTADERVVDYLERVEKQRDRVAVVEALHSAMEDRRQMLVQIAARQRSEADHY